MSQFGLPSLILRNPKIANASSHISQALQPATFLMLPYAEAFVSNPWICYGIAPVMAVFFGAAIACTLLELLGKQAWIKPYMITYSSRETRDQQVAATQAKVNWATQVWSSLSQIAGPMNIVGCAVQRYMLEYLRGVGGVEAPLPSLLEHCLDFYLLMLLADLGLYLGHRVQHHNKWLWDNAHSVHHQLMTPTAWSFSFIDSKDALLQSAIPLICAQTIARAHPVTHVLYLFFHLATNAHNHSGIHFWLTDLIFLRWLPLRCDVRLHDAHHRFTGFGPNGKNFGEFVWLWDWLFGTLSLTGEVMSKQGRK